MSSTLARYRRPNVDFTDENLSGLRVSYTSFENQHQQIYAQQQQRFLSSMAGTGNPSSDSAPQQTKLATCSIDLSLAKSASQQKAGPNRQGGNGGSIKQKDQKDAVLDLTLQATAPPSDLPVYNLVLDPTKLVCFYGREHFLSNYSVAPMTINGVAYRTVEHYYEACKLFSFGGFQWSSQLNIVKDPGAAKVTSKRLMQFVDRRRVEAWKRSQGLAVIEYALMQKFSQNSSMADKLLETGDGYLAHCNQYDTLWGTGLNIEKVKQWATTNQGATLKIPREIDAKTLPFCPTVCKGQNALGYLIMQVRQAIKVKLESGADDDDIKQPPTPTSAKPATSVVVGSKPSTVGKPQPGAVGDLVPSTGPTTTAAPSVNVVAATSASLLSPDASETLHKVCVQLAQINVQNSTGLP